MHRYTPISDLVILVSHNISPSTASATIQRFNLCDLFSNDQNSIRNTFCFSMRAISSNNFSSVFTSPCDFRLWETSRFAYQFSGRTLWDHHIARSFFINDVWGYDNLEICRLKISIGNRLSNF